MGNCIGRKSSKHRERKEYCIQTLSTSLSNESIVLVSCTSEQINSTSSLKLKDITDEENSNTMGFLFIKEKEPDISNITSRLIEIYF